MELTKRKILNEYLPIAVIVVIIWQIGKDVVYLLSSNLYNSIRTTFIKPTSGLLLGMALGLAVIYLMHRPQKEEKQTFVMILACIGVYIILGYIAGA